MPPKCWVLRKNFEFILLLSLRKSAQKTLVCNLHACGLFRNVSGWLRHPPARLLVDSPNLQDPKSIVSFQVLDKENTEVLISRQIDISVKWSKKSSNGILSMKARFSRGPWKINTYRKHLVFLKIRPQSWLWNEIRCAQVQYSVFERPWI